MRIHRPARKVRQNYPAVAEPLEIRRLLAADLVISEFMASNSKTLKDQAGEYSDWIEIHNAGNADANLGDYFLTDKTGDPEEWRFPQQTLAAGAYRRLCVNLRKWRLEADLTQRELAARLRKPHSHVHKVEVGDRRIDPIEFVAWCRACGIRPAGGTGQVARN